MVIEDIAKTNRSKAKTSVYKKKKTEVGKISKQKTFAKPAKNQKRRATLTTPISNLRLAKS